MFGKEGSVFWPVTLVLLGSILLLVKMGVLPASLVNYWPVLLIVFGLMGLSNINEPVKTTKKTAKKKPTKKKK